MAADLHVERTGTRTGVARNGRGASVTFGPDDVEGSFTPGELLALALAACNVMSADLALSRRLGEDVEVTADVRTTKLEAENRYSDAVVEMSVGGTAGLDAEALAQLRAVVDRAVERGCTVGRTLAAGLPHTLVLTPR